MHMHAVFHPFSYLQVPAVTKEQASLESKSEPKMAACQMPRFHGAGLGLRLGRVYPFC